MSELTRENGRGLKDLRELTVEVGVLDRANGSARVYLGKNLAIATVYGPREMHPKHAAKPDSCVVRTNYRMATFSVDDYKRPFPSRREKEISKILSEAYESVILVNNWPRSVIDVHVEMFASDGGTRTAAAIAITAALADAGIPMRDLPGGIASGIYEDTVVLDLTGHEDMKGSGDMPMVYSPAIDEVSLFQLDGKFTFEQFKEAFNTSKEAIGTISGKIREAIKEKYLTIRHELGVTAEDEEEVDQDLLDDTSEDEVISPVLESEVSETTEQPVVPQAPPAMEEVVVPVSQPETIPETSSTPEPVGEPISTIPTPTEVPAPVVEEVVETPAPTDAAVSVEQVSFEEMSAESKADEEDDEGKFSISNKWFMKAGAELKPMPANDSEKKEDDEDEETSSIMRDLEYSFDEED